jgi:hypothetical protein
MIVSDDYGDIIIIVDQAADVKEELLMHAFILLIGFSAIMYGLSCLEGWIRR